jgi:hypothetical protein
MINNKNWKPEIMYEETADGLTAGLPFIDVPEDKNMPTVLFMYESRKIQEEELEKEIILHSYASMLQLKDKLSAEDYDKVRIALGLKPLEAAIIEGSRITESVNKNLN